MKLKWVAIALIPVIFLLICANFLLDADAIKKSWHTGEIASTSPTPSVQPEESLPEPTENPYTIKFDPATIKPGNKVGSMKLKSISGFKSSGPTEDAYVANFTGRVTVTGTVTYSDDAPEAFSVCMIDLTPESLAQLPQGKGDTGNISFCFSNPDLVKAKLAGATKATVIIDNYLIPYIPVDASIGADFVSVVKK